MHEHPCCTSTDDIEDNRSIKPSLVFSRGSSDVCAKVIRGSVGMTEKRAISSMPATVNNQTFFFSGISDKAFIYLSDKLHRYPDELDS